MNNVFSSRDHERLQEAFNAQRNGMTDNARHIYEELLKKYPDSIRLVNALATVYLDQGRLKEALIWFEKAVRLEPSYVPALYNLARVKQILQETSEAKRIYERITSLQPDFGPAWNNLGLILRDEGKVTQAFQAMQKASELMPGYPEALNNLGVLLDALGRIDEAEATFKKAIGLQAEYVSAHFNLACLYHRAEKFDDAEKELKWVLSRKPDDPAALYLFQTLGKMPSPDRAPAEYVSTTFDDCAVNFEKQLAALAYQTPEMLFSFVRPHLRNDMAIMDLGCGTGLGAEYYREFASILCGMDCSAKMLKLAERKGVYDRLFQQDILAEWTTDYLFDCIYSSDCLVYFGDLKPVFSVVSKSLSPNGIFAFSVEILKKDKEEGEDFILRPSGRFAHRPAYVHSCLRDTGLSMVNQKECELRKEAGRPVDGLLVIAKRNPEPD